MGLRRVRLPVGAVLEADEVIKAAGEVDGMVSFFSLLGGAIEGGRSLVAYRTLIDVGLTPHRSWYLIESWARMVEMESTTGWTPEAAAMGYVIADVDHWRRVKWTTLVWRFALTADLRIGLGPSGRP